MSHDHSWVNLNQINQHVEIIITLEGNQNVKSVIIIEEICSVEGCPIGRDGAGVEFDIRQRTRQMEEGRSESTGLFHNSKES